MLWNKTWFWFVVVNVTCCAKYIVVLDPNFKFVISNSRRSKVYCGIRPSLDLYWVNLNFVS